MKLFKLSQDIRCGYDAFDSAVVAAESEEEARLIHPISIYTKDVIYVEYTGEGTWCPSPEDVYVEYIGEAKKGTVKGVIVASFVS